MESSNLMAARTRSRGPAGCCCRVDRTDDGVGGASSKEQTHATADGLHYAAYRFGLGRRPAPQKHARPSDHARAPRLAFGASQCTL